ncbi:unnamed protein product [Lactuca virosa]|uniref:AAA+ ATPase domain-containing protein n=1 Tax=Lactuca virosa TaxID=75947 RepID=A0AAU9N790_9ASTR|nr:unnamed protein product [Lactuca virosa]
MSVWLITAVIAFRETFIMHWTKLFHLRTHAKNSCGEEGEMVETACGDTNDLVGQVGKLERVIGRDEEVREVISILSGKTKNNPLLIGEPGVVKLDVVKGLAQMIFRGDVPINLHNVQVRWLDIVYTKDKLKGVLKEVREAQGKVILFIDNIHLALGAEAEWSMDAADLLQHMIATGQLWCIGGTTLEGYKKLCLEKDAAVNKYFHQVFVTELSIPDTMSILFRLKERYDGVRILDRALVVAVQLSSRYITGCLPNKAINLVDEACVNMKAQLDEIHNLKRKLTKLEIDFQSLKKENDKATVACLVEVRKKLGDLKDKVVYKKKKDTRDEIRRLEAERNNLARAIDLKLAFIKGDENVTTVGPYEIAEVVSRCTGIPVTKLLRTNDDKERVCGLANRLHQRVVGQDQAINDVAEAVLRSRAGFGRLEQPIASILFLGPDCVAKTELAKALAEELFYDQKFLITIYMSGYSGDAIDLAEVIKRNDYGIVLFDGVETAHEAMFNTLFRMLDDRWLSDPPDTVLILNCNFGTQFSASKVVVTHHFKTDLIDRLDEIVVFDADP